MIIDYQAVIHDGRVYAGNQDDRLRGFRFEDGDYSGGYENNFCGDQGATPLFTENGRIYFNSNCQVMNTWYENGGGLVKMWWVKHYLYHYERPCYDPVDKMLYFVAGNHMCVPREAPARGWRKPRNQFVLLWH